MSEASSLCEGIHPSKSAVASLPRSSSPLTLSRIYEMELVSRQLAKKVDATGQV